MGSSDHRSAFGIWHLHLESGIWHLAFAIWNPQVNDAWIADRMENIDASGIRKAFDMAKAMKDPINLSIGLPDFDVAEPVKAAAIEAIRSGKNQYTVTQGIPELQEPAPGRRGCRVSPRRPPGPDHLGHGRRPPAGHLLGGQSRRRGDHLRPLLRHVPAPGDAGRGDVGPRRHLPRLPDQAPRRSPPR